MKTVKFTWPHPINDRGYHCSEIGDQSGEYVRAEVVADLLGAVKSALKIIVAVDPWENRFSENIKALRVAIKKFDDCQ